MCFRKLSELKKVGENRVINLAYLLILEMYWIFAAALELSCVWLGFSIVVVKI